MQQLIRRLSVDKYFSLAIAFSSTVAIIFLSLNSPSKDNDLPIFEGHDKVYHFISYFILTIVYFLMYKNYFKTRFSLIKAAVSVTMLGVILEFIQPLSFFNRDFDVYDLIANFIGVIFAIITIKIFIRIPSE